MKKIAIGLTANTNDAKECSAEIWSALSLKKSATLQTAGKFDSCFAVSDLAATSIAAVGCAVASLIEKTELSHNNTQISVDQRLANLWFQQSIYPIDWALPPTWDALAGDYQTKDGWIKLHTNLESHRRAALRALGIDNNRDHAEAAIKTWQANELETAIVAEGGVAAAMRSQQQWQQHEQGIAVAAEPLIDWGKLRSTKFGFIPYSQAQPLKGLRVLDLTRVLAGPVATRTLAGLGADVLRIDPPGWDEPFVVPDITLGKRCAYLQLNNDKDRRHFENLLKSAHILVHGYRPGALDKLGYKQETRQKISPALIEVSLCAYGWNGPWANRRGFDSLVQMSSGIADTGMHYYSQEKPTPLPVQALDHATGYLMAAAAIQLLRRAVTDNGIGSAKLSLARTAELLKNNHQNAKGQHNKTPTNLDFQKIQEQTPWGPANRLLSPLTIQGTSIQWKYPANNLGTSSPDWHES